MPATLQDLQRQLREKFPEAHRPRNVETLPPTSLFPPLPKGALTELSPHHPAAPLALVLSHLLSPPEPPPSDLTTLKPSTAPSLALIDGRDSFDPASYGPAACARLLWIRCHHAAESLRCADLLLRDGNLPLLVLDLQLNPLSELRAIPTSSWHRLRNLAAQSGSTLLAFTPNPLVPAAALQLSLTNTFTLSDLENPTPLTETLQIEAPIHASRTALAPA